MTRCSLLLFILIMMNTVQGYKKPGHHKGGYYGHTFRQPIKIPNYYSLAYNPYLSFSSGPYMFPNVHIHKPFSLSPYTLHKKMHYMKKLAKKDYYRIPKFYRLRNIDTTKEPSSKTLIWDSSKSIFVRPGAVKRLTFDVPYDRFSFGIKTKQPDSSIYTWSFPPGGRNRHEQFPVGDGSIPRFTESFPNFVTQSEPALPQIRDIGNNLAGTESVFTGNDFPNPTGSVTDNVRIGSTLPSGNAVNIVPNTNNIITSAGQIHLPSTSEVSPGSMPLSTNADNTISTTDQLTPITEGPGNSLGVSPNTTVGIDVTPSLGIVNTLPITDLLVDTRLPNEGLPISVDLFNSEFGNDLRSPGVEIEARLPDINGVRSISATDAFVLDTNQLINNIGGVNLVNDVAITPVGGVNLVNDVSTTPVGGINLVNDVAITSTIGTSDINEGVNSDLTRENSVTIIDGQTAVPVGSVENPFLEPMENMGAFGPGPYYTCHPPSRVVCNANSDWYSVIGIEEWCKQNCVVDNYSSYCDDDRCSCKCVESE